MATDFTSQITAWYQAVQYRNPPAAELAVYNASLQSGTLTTAQVQNAIITDVYTTNFVNPVIREYQAAFGRVPDQAGVNYWANAVANGTQSLQTLATTFASSTEFQARFGATATTTANSALVTALYTNVYGRAPDAAGLAYWVGSGFTAAQLLNAFANAQEFISATSAAVTAFEQLEIAGTAPTTGSLFSVAGSSLPGSTFALTTGLDLLTGTSGNDSFIGSTATLQAGDNVNGGAGIDQIQLFTNGTAISGLTVSNVEKVYVQNDTAAQTVDASAFAGATLFSAQSSATSLTFTGLSTSQSIGVKGTVTAGANLTYTFSSVGGSADTATLVLDAAKMSGGSTLTAAGIETLNVNGNGTIVGLTDTSGSKLVINADSGKSISITDAATSTFKTVDASASAGNVTVDISAQADQTETFTGGSGNDKVIFGANFTSADTVNGGAGTDTLSLAGADLTTAANDVIKGFNTHVTNVEQLEFTANALTLKVSDITAFTPSKIIVNDTVAAAATFTDMTAATTLSIVNAGAVSDTAKIGETASNISYDGTSSAVAASASLTTAGAQTINLASNGTAGIGANTTGAITDATNSKFVITGSQDLTIASFSNQTTVDASAFTGKLVVTGSAAQDIIIGGTAADTINATAGGDTYTGNGGADKFVFTNVNQALSATLTTIKDFTEGTDKLDVSAMSTGAGVFSATKLDVSAAATLSAALDLASTADGSGNAVERYFQFGGDTYVVVDNSVATTFAATDAVIKLTGLHTLTATDIVA